ncbi:hypothetical protein [Salinirubrum litoreum]|uniref:Uncharacterized protein n=1 Tax=Salinirubrum litoreum TaxID=1126234 RepID=A0ABD5RER9_9EURY|nr:hypothetical protein [Salinirubrum litoreum]
MADDKHRDERATRDVAQGGVSTVLFGSGPLTARWRRLAGVALGLALVTFTGYELGVFAVSGGVVFVPAHAALVCLLAAGWAGYAREGLLGGWLLAVATLLGWQAEWATEISARPLVERIAYVVEPTGLAVLAVLGAILAVLGFSVGAVGRWSVERLRAGRQVSTDG